MECTGKRSFPTPPIHEIPWISTEKVRARQVNMLYACYGCQGCGDPQTKAGRHGEDAGNNEDGDARCAKQ